MQRDKNHPSIVMWSLGNSLGGLHLYTELFDRYPVLQGGFIWDWVDQSLWNTAADGTRYMAYDGDSTNQYTRVIFAGMVFCWLTVRFRRS